MARIFVYDNREHPDPDPNLPLEQVQKVFADFFPEVATAEVKTTQRGETAVHEFIRRVGTKGGEKQECEECGALRAVLFIIRTNGKVCAYCLRKLEGEAGHSLWG